MTTKTLSREHLGDIAVEIAIEVGFNLQPTQNMLYTVRGQHAQLENFAAKLYQLGLSRGSEESNAEINELIQIVRNHVTGILYISKDVEKHVLCPPGQKMLVTEVISNISNLLSRIKDFERECP